MAIVAAVATPSQDAFSMIAMFLPLLILYEVSVVARFVEPSAAAKPHGSPRADDGLARGPA